MSIKALALSMFLLLITYLPTQNLKAYVGSHHCGRLFEWPPEELRHSRNYGCTNKDSYLSWGASYELMAYLNSYRATRDKQLLREFLIYAEYVKRFRDDNTGLMNEYNPTWAQTNYTDGVQYATVVGDGMISFPFADFASLVLIHDQDLQKEKITLGGVERSFQEIAYDYYYFADEVVEFHKKELNSSGTYRALPETSNYFQDSNDLPMSRAYELPFNQSLAMGRTVIKLGEIPGIKQKAHQDAAYKMAGRFMSWISDRSGTPYWVYWLIDGHVYEDVSHGHVDVDFMRLYYEAGYPGMKWNDVYGMSKTFVSRAYKGNGVVAYDIMGINMLASPDYRDSMSWMMLSPYNNSVKLIGINARYYISSDQKDTGYGAYAMSLAEEFGGREKNGTDCTLASKCSSGICSPSSIQGEAPNFISTSMSCRSWIPTGSFCLNNLSCSSGLCDFSSGHQIKLNLLDNSRTSRLGICKSR